jgi:hypothetical protein
VKSSILCKMRPGPLPPPRELSSDLLLERVRRNARATELILHIPHTHLEMSTVQTVAPRRAVLARRSGTHRARRRPGRR